MSRLEIRVDGRDVEARAMLLVATNILKALRSIERRIARERGIKSKVNWRVDMQSGNEYGLIAIRGESTEQDGISQALTAEVMARLKGQETP